MSAKFALATLMIAACASTVGAAEPTVTSARPVYGCLKVIAPSIAIKERSVGTSTTLTTASKGEILIKRRRFCVLGSCAVTTRNGVVGYVDKAATLVAACPSKLGSKKA